MNATRHLFRLALATVLLVVPLAVLAQQPDNDDAPTRYDSQGRRDPFVPPGALQVGGTGCSAHAGTLRGVSTDEVKVTAILRTPSGALATLEGGPTRQAYFAHVGDELCDGTIHAIDLEAGVVLVRQPTENLRGYVDVVRPLYGESGSR